MKTIVPATLYVFNLAVLLLIALLVPGVHAGWGVLWASVVLTVAVVWLKPLIHKGSPAWSRSRRTGATKAGETVVQMVLVFAVELAVWVIVVSVGGHDPQLVLRLPPAAGVPADRVGDLRGARRQAAGTRQRALRPGVRGLGKHVDGDAAGSTGGDLSAASAETQTAKAELHDGLTPEQRRMLDELGNG